MDPFFNRYYLAVKYSSSAWFDRLIIYDWGLGEFTQISNAVGILFPVASGMLGYTLEGLSAVSASLDALPFSLDSKVWQGGAPVMAAIDASNKLGFYSGDNAEATITTQEFGATDGSLTRITEAMPVIDTQSALLSLGTRMRRSPDDVVVWTAEGAQSANTGIVRKRSRARYHSFRLGVPENVAWTHAQGVTHNGVPAGVRYRRYLRRYRVALSPLISVGCGAAPPLLLVLVEAVAMVLKHDGPGVHDSASPVLNFGVELRAVHVGTATTRPLREVSPDRFGGIKIVFVVIASTGSGHRQRADQQRKQGNSHCQTLL
jgi:hypothetical protein